MVKRKNWVPLLSLVGILLLTSFQFPKFDYSISGMQTIVIDAGHGGKDPGCHGTDAWEKDVTLEIALQVEALLKEQMPHLEVILTRSDDRFIELHNRAKHAYTNKADFFVSIHCNANDNKEAFGTETYVMGLHKENANLNMIIRENKSILMEDGHEEAYGGFDPSSPSAYILFSLLKNAFLEQSIGLAKNVEDQFKTKGRHSRGVKQAGFLVLWKAGTPSILIETGFLSNKDEETFLTSDTGKEYIAGSIFRAVREYAKAMD